MVKRGPEPASPEPEPEPVNLRATGPRWALRDWIAAVALFAATAGVVLWQNAHVAVLFDLSYILNTAERIALGQMPYRDFPLAHAPLTFLLQAAIVRITGRAGVEDRARPPARARSCRVVCSSAPRCATHFPGHLLHRAHP
jgi:hypothetical protein